MKKIDLKKQFKPLYSAKKAFHRIVSEDSSYLALSGKGTPGGDEFQGAIQKMYGMAYTLKFHLKNSGILDFGVPSLETRYFDDPAEVGMENVRWQMLIRVPSEVTEEQVTEARRLAEQKKETDLSEIERSTFREGTCIQTTHVGPYEELGSTYKKLEEHLIENGLSADGPPHEVYLSDPRRCSPENLKTVVRIPIAE